MNGELFSLGFSQVSHGVQEDLVEFFVVRDCISQDGAKSVQLFRINDDICTQGKSHHIISGLETIPNQDKKYFPSDRHGEAIQIMHDRVIYQVLPVKPVGENDQIEMVETHLADAIPGVWWV